MLEQAAQGEPADVEINEHLGDAYFAAGPPDRGALRLAGGLGLCRGPGDDADRAPRWSRADAATGRAVVTPRGAGRGT